VELELDLTRLAELQQLLGTELPEIVATLLGELTSALSGIDAGLGAGDLGAVALAAHAARNSALMIDARQILGYLEELEVSARSGEPEAVSAANDRLRASWPALRTRLEQIGQ
jgi:HPt (histidine-containing phosphotransfer) domain-containing protein